MQYNVPQFIEVEDKIIGPLTLKQFLWLLISAGIIFLLYKLLVFPIFLVLAIPLGIFGGFGAFYKIQGKSFGSFLIISLTFFLKPKVFFWKKEELAPKAPLIKKEAPKEKISVLPKVKKYTPTKKLEEMARKINF